MSQTSTQKRVAVIMAGGSGERFWPLSRKLRPKQLLRLTHDTETMLSEAVTRLAAMIPPKDIYVATGEHLTQAIARVGVGVPDDNLIAEPCKRNTAGCILLAAARLLAKYEVEPERLTMAITTADHQIGEPDRFRETVTTAMEAAERHDALATIGIEPTRPETGYGYIRILPDAQSLGGMDSAMAVFPVDAFVEKPDRTRAEEFVRSGRHFWNSGMFAWKMSTFQRELREVRPDLSDALGAMTAAVRQSDDAALRTVFEGLESISIDYALMERASKVVVVPADFPWDDVGAWTALERTRRPDGSGNVTHGDPVLVDCQDCIVYNDAGPGSMAVGVVGLRDVVVVVADDAVLVMPKDRAQEVREVVKELQKRKSQQV